ncbi:glycosyltransferase family 4 protein [Neobacillus niacini]|uniref:glycosyltransferase family 4 protein n=1 Tax=Neobacillus niacini TaxID=86668 RepID=UPI0007AB29CC|nr:glycosyltransferase family 4 protein [Neobacillus niacini]MEC1525875.1 glycosyltransferase family 4 protein [Neobacillus niacini]
MKKNILLIILNSAYGGAERHVLDICRYLDRSKFNLSIIVPENTKIEEELKGMKNLQVQTVNRGSSSILSMSKLIKQMNPDTIHVHSPRATLMAAIAVGLAGFKGNFITTAHGWIPNRLKLRKGIELVYISALKRYSKIIAVSDDVKKTLNSNNIPLDRIETIYNGVEIEETKLSHTASSRKVVFLGRYIEEKGLPYLLEALKEINKSELKNKLTVDFYGDGPLKEYVDQTIKELNTNNVRNCGFMNPDQVIKTLRNYDILIMPSIQEGFPYTLVEAFSAGIPVIASSVGGIPEALENGFNGFLTTPKSSEDLKIALETFIRLDDAKVLELKKNALDTSKKFNVVDMVKYIEKNY